MSDITTVAICPVCGKVRHLVDGKLELHKRKVYGSHDKTWHSPYHAGQDRLIPCEGGGAVYATIAIARVNESDE